MLDRGEPVVAFKLEVLGQALSGLDSAVLFGDMWRIDGGYTVECARQCERVMLIDSLETAAWQEERIANPAIDFRKGDFSDPLFMATVCEQFGLGVVFDILLHQPTLLGTLALMLDLVGERFCVVQPMLEEQAHPGTVTYLPGNTSVAELYPLEAEVADHKLFDVDQVNHSHWIWGMTPSFLTAAMAAEGFEPIFENTLGPLANPRWNWWGAVYERQRPRSEGHWRNQGVQRGIYPGDWSNGD
jgi:hypothetical protein